MAISTSLRLRLRVRVPFKIKMFLMHERFLMERNEMKANGLEVNQPARDDNGCVGGSGSRVRVSRV